MRPRKSNGGMPPEAITDEKRFVRGLHWRRTRYYLRARDHVHNRAWRMLTIAGPVPSEEIKSIRAVMPDAHITAIDLYSDKIAAARLAGANEVYKCDITPQIEIRTTTYNNGYQTKTQYRVPTKVLRDKHFDAICLDFTGPANDWLKGVVSCYHQQLNPRGVMIVTFSYGRDVLEALHEEWIHASKVSYAKETGPKDYLKDIPELIAARVWYVLRGLVRNLDSCLQYRSNAMPMVSCLLAKGKNPSARFEAVHPDDYVMAVTPENLGDLFACPADTIEALRKTEKRKLAARKAVATRKHRQLTDERLSHDPKFLTFFARNDQEDDDND